MTASGTNITEIPRDADVWNEVAEWSIAQWGAQFPGDTAQTYIDLYAASCNAPGELPKVYVAREKSAVVGTVTLVADDELPGATEPGPWLAALYVRDDARGRGVGRALVHHCENQAAALGVTTMWLYTPDHRIWYETLGWTFTRVADLHGSSVSVMVREF